jgi:acetyl esterase/lipase
MSRLLAARLPGDHDGREDPRWLAEKSARPIPFRRAHGVAVERKQVTDKTPPTFLTHARTDAVVPVAHSQMFYEALKAHGVPAEFQEFPKGNHGYNGYKGEEWDAWQKRSLEWLGERGLLKPSR